MTRKIFRSVFFVSLIVLAISYALIMGTLYQYTENVERKQLRTELDLAAAAVQDDGLDYLDELTGSSLRLTWISSDGSVLFDSSSSDTAGMENHLEREEVREALQSGYGESSRYSRTLLERLLYAAKRLDDGTVLRVSVTQNSIFSLILGMLQPLVIILFLAVILSAVFARHVSQRVVKPINSLDLDHPLDNTGYDELSPIFLKIHSQQQRLASQKDDLKRKQEELDAVLENMREGMILMNAEGIVISINDAAKKILNTDDVRPGMSLPQISRNLEIAGLIESAMSGDTAEKTLPLSGRVYQVIARPVRDNVSREEAGITVVFFDVTERERSEQLRREFTANVSHELKTPLHSISGYSELIKDGVARPEDIPEFAEKIYSEAQRTISMVEDIISLSHLDEGADDIPFEETDVYQIAGKAVSSLMPEAEKKNIAMNLHGEKTVIAAKRALISQILTNLCDNAVKYNSPGGHVDVTVKSDGEDALITVSDNGIGIPKEDQERIFERFYRVDKSHSREIGGTGLGLSIVKHAVMIHHGTIGLESEPGRGTTVTVRLPVSPDRSL